MKNLLIATLLVLTTICLGQNTCYQDCDNLNAIFAGGGINMTGRMNSILGEAAGASLTLGEQNCFFGFDTAIQNTTGSANSFFGVQAGNSNTTGSTNTFIGSYCASSNEQGFFNTIIGAGAGTGLVNGARNVMIGVGAGPGFDVSNRLYIDNKISGNIDPLIYGEFDNHFVRINGTFEVTAGLSNPSDINLKTNFKRIDQLEILDKLAKINIQQWTYKDRTDEKHIGVTAQDFYKAFGLGADDKHISTIDADGVALAAIQALKEKNEVLENEVRDLKIILNSILSKMDDN